MFTTNAMNVLRRVVLGSFLICGLGMSAFADGPVQLDRLDRLEQLVSDLSVRVTGLEQQLRNGSGRSSWSCSAQCGGYYGTRLSYRMVNGGGATAAEAYEQMRQRCPTDDHLFNGVNNDTGNSVIPATIQNSCVRD